MTRVPGTPLAECWLEFDLEQRRRSIEELASFTRKLARFTSSHTIGSVSTAVLRSTSLGVIGPSPVRTPLSLPGRRGANNLRPFTHSTTLAKSEHRSTASFLACAVESEVAFLRQHQRPAVRCFNVNMLRLRQCDMEDEIPADASFGSTTSATYKKQLRALGTLAQDMVSPMSSAERFVLGHLDLSPENILVEPETGAITGIVDWEFSGFVPDWMALSPPSWIADECLPSWNGSSWTTDHRRCERDSFNVDHSFDAAQSSLLRAVWEKEVAWDSDTMGATQHKAQEKRKMWKACMSEWHQLERACAWARGIISSRLDSQVDVEFERGQLNQSYSDSEVTHDEKEHPARCNSPSTAESSAGPHTPVDAVCTRDLPFLHPSMEGMEAPIKEKDRPDLKPAPAYTSDDGDDEADEYDEVDAESDGVDEIAVDDFDFEELALAFEPPPLPHMSSVPSTVARSSPQATIVVRQPSLELLGSISDGDLANQKQPGAPTLTEKSCFSTYMNSISPPSNLPAGSLWGAFWEVPKVDVSRDLDFVIERDLDAGW